MTQPSAFARLLSVVLCGSLLALSGEAYGDTFTWTGAVDNNWSTPGNWTDGGPGAQNYPGELGNDQDLAVFSIAATPTLDVVAISRVDVDISENITASINTGAIAALSVRNVRVIAAGGGAATLSGTASITPNAGASSIDVTQDALTITTLDLTSLGVVCTVVGNSQLTLTNLSLLGTNSTSLATGAATAVDVGTLTVTAGANNALVSGAAGLHPTGSPTWTFNDDATISAVTHDTGTTTFATGANSVTLTALSIDEDATLNTGAGNAVVVGGISVTNGAGTATISGAAGVTTAGSISVGTAARNLTIAQFTQTGTGTTSIAGNTVEFTAITLAEGATINTNAVPLVNSGVSVTAGAGAATISGAGGLAIGGSANVGTAAMDLTVATYTQTGTGTVSIAGNAVQLTAISLIEGATINTNAVPVVTSGIAVAAGAGAATISGTGGISVSGSPSIGTAGNDLTIAQFTQTGTGTTTLAGNAVEFTAVSIAGGATLDTTGATLDTAGVTVSSAGTAVVSNGGGLRPNAACSLDTTLGSLSINTLLLNQNVAVSSDGGNTLTLTNITWTDSTLTVDGPTVTMPAAGTIAGDTIYNGGAGTGLTVTSGSVTLENNGTALAHDGTIVLTAGTLDINEALTSSGTIDVNGGTFTLGGALTTAAGGVLDIDSLGSTHTINGNLTNDNGANGATDFLILANGTLVVTGSIQFGADGNADDGQFTHTGGTFRLGGTNWNSSDDNDVYAASGTATVELFGGNQTLDFDGTVAAAADFVNLTLSGTGTKSLANFDPAGALTVTGTLTINAGVTLDMDVGNPADLAAGTVVVNEGILDMGARALDVAGSMTLGDGTFVTTGADLVGTGTVEIGAGLTIDTANADGNYDGSGDLTFDGTGDLDANGDSIPADVFINDGTAAVITVTLQSTVTVNGLDVSGASDVFELNSQVLNTGTLDVTGDLFNTAGGAALIAASGTVTIDAGAELSLGGGSGVTAGTGRLTVAGGSAVNVNGTLTGSVGVAGVAIDIANGNGNFTLNTGAVSLGTGNLQYGGDSLSYQAATTWASTGGSLVFNRTGGDVTWDSNTGTPNSIPIVEIDTGAARTVTVANGTDVVTGALTITQGTLFVDDGETLACTSLTIDNAGGGTTASLLLGDGVGDVSVDCSGDFTLTDGTVDQSGNGDIEVGGSLILNDTITNPNANSHFVMDGTGNLGGTVSPQDLELVSATVTLTASFTGGGNDLNTDLRIGNGTSNLDLNGFNLEAPEIDMFGTNADLVVTDPAPGTGELRLTGDQQNLNDDLTVSSGTVEFQGTFANAGNSGTITQTGGTIIFSDTTDLTDLGGFDSSVAGLVQFAGASYTVTTDGTTDFFNVETTGTAGQLITLAAGGGANGPDIDGSLTLNGQNLTVSGGGLVDIEGAVTLTTGDFTPGNGGLDVEGSVAITVGETLTLGSGTNNVLGSVSGAGELDMASNDLSVGGAAFGTTTMSNTAASNVTLYGNQAAQAFTIPGATAFNDITVDHSIGGGAATDVITVSGGTLTAGEVTVDTGILNMVSGSVFDGGANPALTIEAAGEFRSNTTDGLTHDFQSSGANSIVINSGDFLVTDPTNNATPTTVSIEGTTTVDVNGTATFTLAGTALANLDFIRATTAGNWTFDTTASTATLSFSNVDVVDANGAGNVPYILASPSTAVGTDGNWIVGVVWNGAAAIDGVWSNDANWVGGTAPTNTEFAIFTNASNGANDPATGSDTYAGLVILSSYTDTGGAIAGTITLTGDLNFNGSGGATMSIGAGGILSIGGDATLTDNAAGGPLTGTGILRFTGATPTLTLGTATVTTGPTLEVGNADSGTTLDLANGNDLVVGGLLVDDDGATASTLDTSANDNLVDVNGDVTFELAAVFTGGTSNVNVQGNWVSGGNGDVGGTLTFDGAATQTYTAAAGDVHNAVSIDDGGAGTTVQLLSDMNTGTLVVTANDQLDLNGNKLTTTTTADIFGTLNTNAGELEVGTDLEVDGVLNSTAGGTVDINDDLLAASTGTIAMLTGTLEIAGDGAFSNLTAFSSTGLVDFDGTAALQAVNVDGVGETFTNVQVSGNQIVRLGNNNSTWTILGTLDVFGGGTLDFDTFDESVTVGGALTVGDNTPTAGTINFGDGGEVADLNGAVSFDAAGGGTINAGDGLIRAFTTFDLSNGTFNANNGSVELDGTAPQAVTLANASDDWNNVDITGTNTVTVTGGTEWVTQSMDIGGTATLDVQTPSDFQGARTLITAGATFTDSAAGARIHQFTGQTGGECMQLDLGASFVITTANKTITFGEADTVDINGGPTTVFTFTSAGGTMNDDNAGVGTQWTVDVDLTVSFSVSGVAVIDSIAAGTAGTQSNGGGTLTNTTNWVIGSVWTGGGAAGDWNDDANWGGTKPGAGDTAVFNVTSNVINQPSINSGALGTIDGLSMSSAYTGTAVVSATGLSLTNDFIFDSTAGGQLDLATNGATLTFGGNASITGNVGAGGGIIRLTGATPTLTIGSNTTTIDATLQVGNGAAAVVTPTPNANPLDVDALTISAGGGELDMSTNNQAVFVRGNMTIAGTYTEGTSDTTVEGDLANTGTWTNDATADLVFAAPGAPGTQNWSGNDVFEVVIENGGGVGNGTVVTLNGNATATDVTVTGNDTLVIGATRTLTTTDLTVDDNGTLTATTGGAADAVVATNFTVTGPGGVYNETDRDTLVDGNLNVGAGGWVNDAGGTLRLDGGAQNVTAAANLGEVSVESGAGTVDLLSTLTVNGLAIAAGDVFDTNSNDVTIGAVALANPFTVNGTYTGGAGGTTSISCANLTTIPTVGAAYNNLSVTVAALGTATLEGTEAVGGVLTVNGGTLTTGAVTVSAAGITGTGTLNATGGTIDTSAGLTVANYTAGADLIFSGTGNWDSTAATFGPVTVDGAGTVVTPTVAGTRTVSTLDLTNASALTMGTVNLTATGAVDLTAGAYTQAAAATTTVNPAVAFSTDGDTVGVLDFTGAGTLNVTGDLIVAGTIALTANEILFVQAGTFTANGLISMSGANSEFRLYSNAVLGGGVTVGANGAFNANGPTAITIDFADASIVLVNDPTGSVIISPGVGQTTIRGNPGGGLPATRWVMDIDLAAGLGTFANIAVRDSEGRAFGGGNITVGGTNTDLGNNIGWGNLSAVNAQWISTGGGGQNGNWDDADNWAGNNLPIDGSVVDVSAAATVPPTGNWAALKATLGGGQQLNGLNLPDAWNFTASFNGATMEINGSLNVGDAATFQNNSTLTVATNVVIDGGGGTLDMGADVNVTGTISGTGTLDATSNDNVSCSGISVTTFTKGNGTLTINGGTWSGGSDYGIVVLGGNVAAGGATLDADSLDLAGNTFTLGTVDITVDALTDTGAGTGVFNNVNPGGLLITTGGLNIDNYTSGGTLRFNGVGPWTIADPTDTFGTVEILAGGDVTQGSQILAESIDVQGATLITGGLGLRTTNDLTLSGGDLNATTSTVQVDGNWDSSGGTATFSPTGILRFDGGGHVANFTTTPDTLGILSVIGAADVDVVDNSAFTVETVSLQAAGSTLQAGLGTTITVNDDWTVPVGTVFTPDTSTVDFATATAHSLDLAGTAAFFDLRLSGGVATVLGASTLIVQNDLLLDDGGGAPLGVLNLSTGGMDVENDVIITDGTLAPAAASIMTVGGDWTNADTFTPSTSRLTFDTNDGPHLFTAGGSNYYDLYLELTTNAGRVTMQDPATVLNHVELTTGVLDVDTFNLTVQTPNADVVQPISAGANGTLDGNGAGTVTYTIDVAVPGTPVNVAALTYNNLTLSHLNGTNQIFQSVGALTVPGVMTLNDPGTGVTFRMGGDLTVDSLVGVGASTTVDMNGTTAPYTLDLTGVGAGVFPAGIVLANIRDATTQPVATVRFSNAGGVTVGNRTYPHVDLANGTFTWTAGSLIEGNLDLSGGAVFAGNPDLEFSNAVFTSRFDANNSDYDLGSLRVNVLGKTVEVDGNAVINPRVIRDLQLIRGECDVRTDLTIIQGQIGTALDGNGTQARLTHERSNVTLTLGSETTVGAQVLTVNDEFSVADGNPDVTLTLASNGAGAGKTNFARILVNDANASLRLRGNPIGAGVRSNLLINCTRVFVEPADTIGAVEPEIVAVATAGVGTINVNRVEVRDNDATGVINGNTNADDSSGVYAPVTPPNAGLEATNSSKLSDFTNGWQFSGGGNITAQLGEAISNAGGRIANIRVAFDQVDNLNAATLGTVHDRFTLVLLDGSGGILESIVGTASSVEPNTRNLVVTFGAGIGKTDVQNLEVRYVPPASSADFLRNENSTPASFAFTLTSDPAALGVSADVVELVDGATPVVVSSFFQDLDSNGGLDRAAFFLSESAAFTSGAGWCASGFQPETATTALAGQDLTLVIAGETLAAIALDGNGNLFSGADIAARIQGQVRAVMDESPPGTSIVGGAAAHNPLNRPAYKNFTCVYLESEQRYVMTAGIPLQFTGGAYVRNYAGSTVTVVTGGGTDASPGLKLDTGAGGRVEGLGYGDGQAGTSLAGNDFNAVPVDFSLAANNTLGLSLNSEPLVTYEIDGAAGQLFEMAQDLEDKVRGQTLPTPAALANVSSLAKANQEAYSGFVVIVDDVSAAPTIRVLFMAGGEGARSSVAVDNTTSFGAAAGMGVGGAGAVETLGSNNTEVSLEDLSIVSSNGKNLLLGAGVSNITISGTSVVVDLANQVNSGTATPSYTWRDNENRGFLSDASGLPNRASDFANVAALDGVVIVGDDDGDRGIEVDPGQNIKVDATNSIPAFGTTGTTVTYSWALIGAPPPGFALNSGNTAVLDFDALTAGDYDFLLTIVVRDAAGNPVVSGFTNEAGELIATVNVEVLDIPPVADAGAAQSILGSTATLDGNGTFDPNGGVGTLTYLWSAVDSDNNVVGPAAFSAPNALNTDFTPSNVVGFGSGAYTVTLTATKTATGGSHADSIQVVVNDPANLLPVANAGANVVGRTNDVISLNGGASVDPEGSALLYDWQVVTSPVSITLNGATTVNPSFTPDLPGSYVFRLIVEDATALRSPGDTVTIQVVDDLGADTRRPPGAVGVVAALEQAVFLNAQPGGSIVFDPPFFVLAGGVERQATIVDLTSDTGDDPNPGATDGMLAVEVIVSGSLFATVYSPLRDGDLALLRLRFADNSLARVFRFGRAGDPFVLDASQSQDDGAVSSFTWTQIDGPFKFSTLSGNLISVVPQQGATYEFQLFVTDNISLSSLGQLVTVQVLPVLPNKAGPPTAAAAGGAGTTLKDGVATAPPGGTVTLDASGSSSLSTGQFQFGGGSDLTFSWTQLSGPTALFSGGTTGVTAQATLSAAGPYSFQVTVTDGNGVSSKATVWISVDSPVADAPVAVVAAVPDSLMPATGSTTITLNGNLSSGVLPLTFIWSQSAGPPFYVETTSATSSQGTVAIDQPGTYTLALEVVGADGVTSPPAEVTFVILDRDQAALKSGGKKSESSGCALSSGAGARSPGLGAVLLLLLGLAFVMGRLDLRAARQGEGRS